jgi:hypothetical protein
MLTPKQRSRNARKGWLRRKARLAQTRDDLSNLVVNLANRQTAFLQPIKSDLPKFKIWHDHTFKHPKNGI